MQKIEDLISWAKQKKQDCVKNAAEHDPENIEFAMYYEEAQKWEAVALILEDLIWKDIMKEEKQCKK